MIRITVWNEFRQEKQDERVAAVYPRGIHNAIADFLQHVPDFAVATATLDEVEHGLTDMVLDNTDVLIWWGHMAHNDVGDEIVDRIHSRILEGMGLIALHSAHKSKIFMRLMGTTCNLRWREVGESMCIWTVEPSHPIAQGIPAYINLEHEEMYGERFDIPAPDSLVFLGWFEGGEVFRSGCCYMRGAGKIFYFQPGHETYPTFSDENIQKILINAINWANSDRYEASAECIHVEAPIKRII